MISDRSYMYRDDVRKSAEDAMRVVWALIAVNVLAYIFINPETMYGVTQSGRLTVDYSSLYARLSLWPGGKNFLFWQPLTYMFLHGGFGHLFFNMYGLYLFGSLTAPILGRTRFLLLYFVSGLAGAGLWMLANLGAHFPAVGASGALFGVMLSVAMLRPNQEFLMLFLPVPIKAKTMVVVYAIIEIISNYGINDNVAHLAHLGGFLGAYVYLKLQCRREIIWDLTDLFMRRSRPRFYQPPKVEKVSGVGVEVHSREVDRLLDKISKEGVNSLSDEEYAILQAARERMRR